MNRSLLPVIFILFVFPLSTTYASNAYLDSLKITQRAGKSYIVHKVEKGETLFSLSRRYDVEIKDIKELNPATKMGLKVGQRLYIPIKRQESSTKDISAEAKVHKVKQSETLFSIAKQYDVKVGELKRWNGLPDNNISVGDKLIIKQSTQSGASSFNKKPEDTKGRKIHIVKSSETLYSISKMYNVEPINIKKWNNLEANTISIGQKLVVAPKGNNVTAELKQAEEESSSMLPAGNSNEKDKDKEEYSQNDKNQQVQVEVNTEAGVEHNTEHRNSEADYDYKKVKENGFAKVIEKSNDTKKYLALHRSAPIGTIMQVRNEMNNQTVFVRVVGTIPDTDNNNNVLIKISKKAYNRLGAVDARFPVAVSYIP